VTFLATTRCDVLRGSTTDAYGDDVPGATAVLTGEPISIIESGSTTYDPATGESRSAIRCLGRMRGDRDVRESDRIHDLTSGVYYSVLGSRTRGSIVGLADLELDLARTAQDR
jgi:hypothetical protein